MEKRVVVIYKRKERKDFELKKDQIKGIVQDMLKIVEKRYIFIYYFFFNIDREI